jgi:hypothetical protein
VSGLLSLSFALNHAPVLILKSAKNLDAIQERGLVPPANVSIVFSVADDDANDNLTLRFRIDGGRTIQLCPVVRGESVTVTFPGTLFVTTPGTHALYFDLFDGLDASVAVACSYSVIAAPVVAVIAPANSTFRQIDPAVVTLNVSGGEGILRFEYRAEKSSEWISFGNVNAGALFNGSLPSAAFAATVGLHALEVRALDTKQSSAPAVLWYAVGTAIGSAPTIGLAQSQTSVVLVSVAGVSTANRTIALVTVANVSFVRIEFAVDGSVHRIGAFAPGPVSVTLPTAVFANRSPGAVFPVAFNVFDGANRAATAATVEFRIGRPIAINISADLPVPFPPTVPTQAIAVTVNSTVSLPTRYRIDVGEWTNVTLTAGKFQIAPDAFADHLAWTRTHHIVVVVSDGVDAANASLTYEVQPPTSKTSPVITVAGGGETRRFDSGGPRRSERTFTLTLADADNGPLLVDFRVDGGEWGEPAVVGVSPREVTVPAAAFEGHLRPGRHSITFRAANAAASANATVSYVVNSPPELAIVGAVQGQPLTLPATVSLRPTDADGDQLAIQFSIDGNGLWFPAPAGSAVAGGSVINLAINNSWMQPPLEKGSYTILLAAADGFERSEPVALAVTVGVDGPTRTEPPGGQSSGLSVGVVVGIVAGAVFVVALIAVAACLIRKNLARTERYENWSSASLIKS